MHGQSQSSQFKRILALDLGKFNSVLCDYDPATGQHRFQSLATTPAVIRELLASLAGDDPSRVLVVMETCDVAGWVYDIATALGFAVAIANPCNEAWRWTKVKRKTDRDDALKLARMASRGELPTVHMPSPHQRQRRRLVHHRRTLVQRRTQIKNQVRSIFSQQGLSLPRGTKCWTKAGIAQIREEARALSRCSIDELWRGRLQVELQLLAALTKQFESGTMKRVGKITRRGPALLRGMLVEVAWMVYRQSPWAKSFVERVSRGMKSRKRIAIVALARKLLVRLWAMLRDGTTWRETPWREADERNKGEDRGRTAGGCGCSPPEDTAARKPVSSVLEALALGVRL